MILSVEAEQKAGKTSLALTAPKPIVAFCFDMGWERAVSGTRYKYFKDLDIHRVQYSAGAEPDKSQWVGHDITIFELPPPIQLTSTMGPDGRRENPKVQGMRELYAYYIALAGWAAGDSNIQSVVIDTATLTRRVRADAYLQELQESGKDRVQLQQVEWKPANEAIREIGSLFLNLGKNLVLTHHLSDQYAPHVNKDGQVESVPTGNRILEGYNKTYQLIDMGVRCTAEDGKIVTRIIECGYNPGLVGNIVPDATWNRIVSMVMQSTGEHLKLPVGEE